MLSRLSLLQGLSDISLQSNLVCIFVKRGTEALFPGHGALVSGKVCCCCVSLLVMVALVTIESDKLAIDHCYIVARQTSVPNFTFRHLFWGNSC